MISEKMLKLLVLKEINSDMISDYTYKDYIKSNYNYEKISDDYLKLGIEFLEEYALNNTEKSD